MIIVLIFLILFIMASILVWRNAIKDRRNNFGNRIDFTSAIILEVFCLIFLIIPGVAFAQNKVPLVRDLRYENISYEREVLEERLKNVDENITGNELLFNDIVVFNNNLRSTKKHGENIFCSWLCNQRIVKEINYINYPIE